MKVLLLLHLHVKKEAVAAALKTHHKKINQEGMTGHRRILIKFPDYELTSTLLDVMTTKHIFKSPYRFVISDAYQWLNDKLDVENDTHI